MSCLLNEHILRLLTVTCQHLLHKCIIIFRSVIILTDVLEAELHLYCLPWIVFCMAFLFCSDYWCIHTSLLFFTCCFFLWIQNVSDWSRPFFVVHCFTVIILWHNMWYYVSRYLSTFFSGKTHYQSSKLFKFIKILIPCTPC